MKKADLTAQEARWLLKKEGITVRPAYCHSDYVFTSVTMPYPLKNKLNRISKREGLSRSKVIQMLLDQVDEKNFPEQE